MNQERHFGNLNLANYQRAKLKSQLNQEIPLKRRTNSIQIPENSKILEKNEGTETMSISSYEESIDATQKELLRQVSDKVN